MSQVFPTSPEVIYDTLVADTEFMSHIGDYEFQSNSGTQIPAISVSSPGKSLPQLRRVTGLECIIHDAADVRRKDYVAGSSDILPVWRMYLVCWEPANGSVMTAAVTRVMQLFSGASSFETVSTPNGIGALVQTMVTIPSDKPILAP